MTDMLDNGMNWLSARRQESLVTVYTYKRDSLSTTLNAQIATTSEQEIDGGGGLVTTTAHAPDFIVLASELVLTGTTITKPETGDVLIATDGTTYKVVRGPGEKEWRWTTSHRVDIRIYTKEVKAS